MTSVKGPSTQVASTNTIINKTPQNTRPITPVRKGILKRPTSPNRQQRRADSIVEDSSLQPKIQDPKSAEQDRKKKRAQFIGQPTISSNTIYENQLEVPSFINFSTRIPSVHNFAQYAMTAHSIQSSSMYWLYTLSSVLHMRRKSL